jgi:glycosyltransferase involved in cell wall biosynthesis
MKIVVSHPTGNRNVRGVISGLLKKDMLAEFNTTLATNPDASWLRLLPARIRQEFLRRTFPIDGRLINTHPGRELARMILPKIGLSNMVEHESGWASVDSVYQDFDKTVAKRLSKLVEKNKISAVYGYEDGALATFTAAKELGLKCIYDLPIAYWETGRKLMKEEAERLPQWAPTLGGGIMDSEQKLERKTLELELADVVVGPGDFVIDSIPAWALKKKLIMSPFGSPVSFNGNEDIKKTDNTGRPLRVLFAGSLGQRKGLGDLFEAIRLLNSKDIELVIMGSLLAPMDFYRNELSEFTFEAGRPHHEVLQLMRSCDIFCLPSIVEGRALVMQEAMSQGLPLIITPNTGGEDLIKEGETGFLVPIRSPHIIAEKLEWFLQNRDKIKEMSSLAKKHANNYTWEDYSNKIVNEVLEFLS